MSNSQCPKCGSRDSKALKFDKAKSRQFQFLPNRECMKCGLTWKPACPKWGAISVVVFGGALFALFATLAATTIYGAVFSEGMKFQWNPSFSQKTSQILNRLETVNLGMFICSFIYWVPALIGWRAARYGIRVLRGKAGELQILSDAKQKNTSDA